jgi:hypothetical protein
MNPAELDTGDNRACGVWHQIRVFWLSLGGSKSTIATDIEDETYYAVKSPLIWSHLGKSLESDLRTSNT